MKREVCAALLLVLAAVSAFPQGTTSRITGTVTDKTGAVVANASIIITNEDTNASYKTASGPAGVFTVDSLQIGSYTVTAEAKGFQKYVSRGNVLSIGSPLAVNPRLEVGSAGDVIEVRGGYELVQTESSANFGNVVDNATLTQLPIVGVRGRNPLDLVLIIPGVVQTGFNATGGGTHVHGSRDRAWNYTLDGIDTNETSAGGSQLSPVRQNPDSLSEFRVITGSFTSEYGRSPGAQVTMVTKSGSNKLHGNGFWFYQSPFLQANDVVTKASQVSKGINQRPQFVQNIYGGSLGGPIIRNKTFFFVNVQLLHALNSFTVTRNVYTDSLKKNGLFRYVVAPGRNGAFGSSTPSVDANGNPLPGLNIATYNLVTNDPAGIGLDSAVRAYLGLAPSPNNFSVGDGLNTAGFTFTAPQLEKQVDEVFKIDHTFSPTNSIFGRWASGHQNTIGDNANNGLQAFPGLPNYIDTIRKPRNLALNWRWSPSSRFTNELVLGMNRFGFEFLKPTPDQGTPFCFNLSGNTLKPPFADCETINSRFLTTQQLVDNFTFVREEHTIKLGANVRYQRHIDHRGSIGSLSATPLMLFDLTTNPVDTLTFKIPTNVNSQDITRLQNSINDLLGRLGQMQQGYVAANGQSFKPAGTLNNMDHRWPEYDLYVQDSWKLRRNLVLDYGLRWEVRLAPGLQNFANLVPNQPFVAGSPASTTLKWVPGEFFRSDFNNFGPSIGLAWDPFGDGKTSVRANYRIAFDRINTFSFSSSVFQGMPGLTFQQIDTTSGQAGVRAKNWFSPPPPAGVTPAALQLLPPFGVSSQTVADPDMRTPKTYMWGLSIQRELSRNTVVSATYNGRHGVGLFGGYDANSVQYNANGFLSAFKTVQAGGQSALFDQLFAADSRRRTGESGADFARRNFASNIAQNAVASLALAISQRTQNGVPLLQLDGMPTTFFQPYPQVTGGLFVLDTRDYSIYHGLELQIERRFVNGLLFQGSFTWSKSQDTRSFDPTFTRVATGSSQSAQATPFSNTNRHLNWAPSDFDRTRVFQSNWVYEMPFGHGKKWGSSWGKGLDELIGGWEIAGNAIYASGRPITFLVGTNTFSSAVQTPASCIGKGCSPYMGSVYFDGGLGQQFFLHTSAFNTTTNCRQVTDRDAQLCIPAAGEFSNVGRNYFRQSINANLNATIAKSFRIIEGHTLQARLEMQNLTNSQMFDTYGSQSIQSGVFSRLNQASDGVMQNNARRMQLSLKYSF